MPSTNRDNFSKRTKKILADRAGHKCSFPACGILTSGPCNVSLNDSINIGVAAHISSAAAAGPRYNSQMSIEERKNISNAIWLCQTHGTLIDKDPAKYTIERLLKMKNEHESHIEAEISGEIVSKTDNDVVALGPNIIFIGELVGMEDDKWRIKVESFFEGDLYLLIKFCEDFDKIDQYDRYVLLNKLGDGRQLGCKPSWEKIGSNYIISFQVLKNFPRMSAHKLPLDLALNENNDIFLAANGDLATVSGLGSLPQKIKLCLSTQLGEYPFDPNLGSRLKEYFDLYRDSPKKLARLIKLEVIRHGCVPYPQAGKQDIHTPLCSVLRVHSVEQISVQSAEEADWILFRFHLDVAGVGPWQAEVPLFVPKGKREQIHHEVVLF